MEETFEFFNKHTEESKMGKDLNSIPFFYCVRLQHQQLAIENRDTSLYLFIALTTLHSSTQVKL